MEGFKNFYSFFNELLKEKNKLIIPTMQRPQAWSEKKIKKIIDLDIDSYFGSIVLFKKNNNEYVIVDGQQRITNFLLMYKLVKDIKNPEVIISESLNEEHANSLKYYYGNWYSKDELINDPEEEERKEHLKKQEILLNEIGILPKKRIYIKKLEKLSEVLKKSYISINIINNEMVNVYDVFIDLNNESTPLTKSDILKAIFIKYHSDNKKHPVLINKKWQEALISIYQAKKMNFDSLILNFAISQGSNIRKSSLVSYFEKEIEIYRSKGQEALDNYLVNVTNKIINFVKNFSVPESYNEPLNKLEKSKDNLEKAMKSLILNIHHYKPLLGHIGELFNKKDNKKSFKKLLLLSYLTNLNAFLNKLKDNSKLIFIRPTEIRENTLFASKHNFSFKEDVFAIFKEWKLKDKNISDIMFDDAFEKWIQAYIVKYFLNTKKEKAPKMSRYMMDWVLFGDQQDKNAYLNNYTLEHIYQKHGNKDKRTEAWTTVLLEGKIHQDMNAEILSASKKKKITENDIFEIKKKYYQKSNHPYTKGLSSLQAFKISDIREYAIEFYGKHMKPLIIDELKKIGIK